MLRLLCANGVAVVSVGRFELLAINCEVLTITLRESNWSLVSRLLH